MSFYTNILCPKGMQILNGLESAFAEKNTQRMLANIKSLYDCNDGELISFPVLRKVEEILTTEEPFVDDSVRIECLRCLGNACIFGSKHSTSTNSEFPYEDVIEWTSSFITSQDKQNEITSNTSHIRRLCVQFLCNYFTIACADYNQLSNNVPKYLYDARVKYEIINQIDNSDAALAKVSCIFLFNCLKKYNENTFAEDEKTLLCSKLLEAVHKGLEWPSKVLLAFLQSTYCLPNVYHDMTDANKLRLLQIIRSGVPTCADESTESVWPTRTIEFVTERFCERCHLILKTAESNLDAEDAQEIVTLLDIIAALTSGSYKEYSSLRCYKSLLLKCIYLLKSIHTIGKESNNCFTPLRSLDSVQSTMRPEGIEFQNHPAFAFKAGLIRVIGNMTHRNKELQDLVREMDVIPVLLDCCNIDARNPLIMQWTILALRHLCENNHANQEIIRNCNRVDVASDDLLKQMGSITLHEDQEGRKIAVVPLPTERK